MLDFKRESSLSGKVAGVDEVGRGAWAGPVFAAAAVLSPDAANSPDLKLINDSKALSKRNRKIIYEQLLKTIKSGNAWIGIGSADVNEIDSLNILQATMLAMQRAVADLPFIPSSILIDGNKTPELPSPSQAIVKGDRLVLSIAAASIYAKVTRDKYMFNLSKNYGGYGWEQNSGYGTRRHQEGLIHFGLTKHHRKSFKPIKKILNQKTIYS